MPRAPILDRFLSFLDASPTPHHAVRAAAGLLDGRGFTAMSVADPPRALAPGDSGYLVDEGSIFAFRLGSRPLVEAGFRVIAAHTWDPLESTCRHASLSIL